MQRTSSSLRRAARIGGMTAAALVAARVMLKPRPGLTEHRMIDWEQVRRYAHARSGEHGHPLHDSARAASYDRIAHEMAPLMAEVLGSELTQFPPFRPLDRRGFIDTNLVIARRLIDPVERLRAQVPDSLATALERRALSRYLGELFGFLSHRVLGQYDPVLQLGPPGELTAQTPSLFLVEPNVELFERAQHVPSVALRRWLILHELTHAWQFESHPWLRDHINELVRTLMQAGLMQPANAAVGSKPKPTPVRVLVGGLPGTIQTQMRLGARVQAVMSLLEGYGNFVMHQVGEQHLEDFGRLETAFQERRKQVSVLERIVIAATGMRMKLRQYETGEQFAVAIAKRAGISTLNRVWEGPHNLPTPQELREPERWLHRLG